MASGCDATAIVPLSVCETMGLTTSGDVAAQSFTGEDYFNSMASTNGRFQRLVDQQYPSKCLQPKEAAAQTLYQRVSQAVISPFGNRSNTPFDSFVRENTTDLFQRIDITVAETGKLLALNKMEALRVRKPGQWENFQNMTAKDGVSAHEGRQLVLLNELMKDPAVAQLPTDQQARLTRAALSSVDELRGKVGNLGPDMLNRVNNFGDNVDTLSTAFKVQDGVLGARMHEFLDREDKKWAEELRAKKISTYCNYVDITQSVANASLSLAETYHEKLGISKKTIQHLRVAVKVSGAVAHAGVRAAMGDIPGACGALLGMFSKSTEELAAERHSQVLNAIEGQKKDLNHLKMGQQRLSQQMGHSFQILMDGQNRLGEHIDQVGRYLHDFRIDHVRDMNLIKGQLDTIQGNQRVILNRMVQMESNILTELQSFREETRKHFQVVLSKLDNLTRMLLHQGYLAPRNQARVFLRYKTTRDLGEIQRHFHDHKSEYIDFYQLIHKNICTGNDISPFTCFAIWPKGDPLAIWETQNYKTVLALLDLYPLQGQLRQLAFPAETLFDLVQTRALPAGFSNECLTVENFSNGLVNPHVLLEVTELFIEFLPYFALDDGHRNIDFTAYRQVGLSVPQREKAIDLIKRMIDRYDLAIAQYNLLAGGPLIPLVGEDCLKLLDGQARTNDSQIRQQLWQNDQACNPLFARNLGAWLTEKKFEQRAAHLETNSSIESFFSPWKVKQIDEHQHIEVPFSTGPVFLPIPNLENTLLQPHYEQGSLTFKNTQGNVIAHPKGIFASDGHFYNSSFAQDVGVWLAQELRRTGDTPVRVSIDSSVYIKVDHHGKLIYVPQFSRAESVEPPQIELSAFRGAYEPIEYHYEPMMALITMRFKLAQLKAYYQLSGELNSLQQVSYRALMVQNGSTSPLASPARQ
ncbi:MAG: hypothetical protein KDK65_05595, partial [Chlamydiia bacterium]|nr:hypothetical protein [Chlamydiia bacterium]